MGGAVIVEAASVLRFLRDGCPSVRGAVVSATLDPTTTNGLFSVGSQPSSSTSSCLRRDFVIRLPAIAVMDGPMRITMETTVHLAEDGCMQTVHSERGRET